MSFSTFFSKQARKPKGIFGRLVMRTIFDKGNAFINNLVFDVMSVKENDCILEVGSGTGSLTSKIAQNIDEGYIEAIDFSNEMVSIARKRNKESIEKGKVKVVEGNFDEVFYENQSFTKACSVNTLYFWPSPGRTAKKLADVLKPGGKLVLGFVDSEQIKQHKLDQDIFSLYTIDDVQQLLTRAGFSSNIDVVSKRKGNVTYHCVTAFK